MSYVAPPSWNLRWGQLEDWLKANGVSRYKLCILVSNGTIKQHNSGGGRHYYNAFEIKRDVIDPLGEGVKVFDLKGKGDSNGSSGQ